MTLYEILDKMINTSKKMYAARENKSLYECHKKDMDELREDFTRVAAHCSKQQLDVFFKHTLGGRNWEQWTGSTLAVRAILLDELSKF